MTLSYAPDITDQEFVLNQSDKWECPLELPEDFVGDDELTGEWINVFSSDNAKQTLTFNDDGSMKLQQAYTFTDGSVTEIIINFTYTVDKTKSDANELNVTWVGGNETQVRNSVYVIQEGILYYDGNYYTRVDNNPATPDEE